MALSLPDYLYDPQESLAHGGPVRASGYLIRVRAENLISRDDGEVGLRRATHAVALAEVTYRAHDPVPGFFGRNLKRQLAERLLAAHLQPQESRFADAAWWAALDRDETMIELRSNLLRLLQDPPTECLLIGVEIHVLLDIHMRLHFGDEYVGVIEGNMRWQHPSLRTIEELFAKMLQVREVA